MTAPATKTTGHLPLQLEFHRDHHNDLRAPTDDDELLPVHLAARSAGPIHHWFYGDLYHDFTGMTHKQTIPIDYCHDPSLILGRSHEIRSSDDGLTIDGALRPDHPTVKELKQNADLGIPYEASITFDAADAAIEEIHLHQEAEVNGRTVSGPAIIFRTWNLRAVAICPLGYDSQTQTQLHLPQRKDPLPMTAEKPLTTTPPADQQQAPPADQQQAPAADQPTSYTAEQIAEFTDQFGPNGVTWLLEGRTIDECQLLQTEAHVEQLNADLDDLRQQIATLTQQNLDLEARLAAAQRATGEPSPATFQDAPAAPRSFIRLATR